MTLNLISSLSFWHESGLGRPWAAKMAHKSRVSWTRPQTLLLFRGYRYSSLTFWRTCVDVEKVSFLWR